MNSPYDYNFTRSPYPYGRPRTRSKDFPTLRDTADYIPTAFQNHGRGLPRSSGELRPHFGRPGDSNDGFELDYTRNVAGFSDSDESDLEPTAYDIEYFEAAECDSAQARFAGDLGREGRVAGGSRRKEQLNSWRNVFGIGDGHAWAGQTPFNKPFATTTDNREADESLSPWESRKTGTSTKETVPDAGGTPLRAKATAFVPGGNAHGVREGMP
ncbi:hypothetical protein P153DRAFT_399070 [Dothidotthia symphoricarpi CBS 119687]|uniref:Uncharacterized protein n=1 Tax=Dothidotthia symphoricarpi CBS 119687 TaxID=1392245 RepID=A0A6A6A774_9PLEO|nr:uncharacterized protein P153DRAFT_399070 [Dothidotthia symphoricarpi CBS 119687]KAF2126993.1 hypothetical protein P153DRAFT_399070 [Dothidotthia symphoricarpi CBS 119687]